MLEDGWIRSSSLSHHMNKHFRLRLMLRLPVSLAFIVKVLDFSIT